MHAHVIRDMSKRHVIVRFTSAIFGRIITSLSVLYLIDTAFQLLELLFNLNLGCPSQAPWRYKSRDALIMMSFQL